MSGIRLFVAYACLVGTPVGGVLGTLWLGQRLVAPLSVSGAWNVEMDAARLKEDVCVASMGIRQPFMEVSQSGPHLTVRLGNRQKTILAGTIDQAILRVGAASGRGLGCTDPLSLRLLANVTGRGDHRILTGTMSIAGCARCPPIPFRAVRGR